MEMINMLLDTGGKAILIKWQKTCLICVQSLDELVSDKPGYLVEDISK